MNVSSKKIICVSIALFILGWISPAENKPEKDQISNLLRRTAKQISGLKIPEAGKTVRGKLRVIRRLRRLIRFSESKLQQTGLQNVVKRLREMDFFRFPEPEFIPGTRFDLLIRYNGKKRTFSAMALKTAPEENKAVDALFQQVRGAVKGGIMERNVRFFPGVNVFRISTPIYPEEPASESLVLPSAGKGLEMFPGVILMKNRIEEMFAGEIQPLAMQVYPKPAAEKIRAGSLMKNMFLRHAAHFTIPVEIELDGKKRKTNISGLKELFPAAEKVRADLVFLALIARMREKDLVDEQQKVEVFQTFILQKLAEIKSSGEKSPSGALLTALYENGGLKVAKNRQKLELEMDVLTRSIKSLEAGFTGIFMRGSYKECSAFFQKNSEVPLNIRELIKTPGETGSE